MKANKAKSIYEATSGDADFISTSVRDLILSYPEEVDDILDRIGQWLTHPQAEKGLTPLGVMIGKLENEARSLLVGVDPDANICTISAAKALTSASSLREAIASNDAERAAADMMQFLLSAMRADLYKTLMTGARLKAGQPRGGKRPKIKQGIALYIKKALDGFQADGQDLSANTLWGHLRRHHDIDKGQDPEEIGHHRIFISEGRICQETNLGNQIKLESIGKEAFRKTFYRVKKMLGK